MFNSLLLLKFLRVISVCKLRMYVLPIIKSLECFVTTLLLKNLYGVIIVPWGSFSHIRIESSLPKLLCFLILIILWLWSWLSVVPFIILYIFRIKLDGTTNKIFLWLCQTLINNWCFYNIVIVINILFDWCLKFMNLFEFWFQIWQRCWLLHHFKSFRVISWTFISVCTHTCSAILAFFELTSNRDSFTKVHTALTSSTCHFLQWSY